MYKGLVLSGGGIKGIYQLGVMHAYQDHGTFDSTQLTHISGTSIGSLIGFLIALGISPRRMYTYFKQTKLSMAINTNTFNRLFHKMGMYDIDRFMEHVCALLVEHEIDPMITFNDVYRLYKIRLYIPVTNLDQVYHVVYSAETTPDMQCIDAIGKSCNIPGIFTHNRDADSQTIVDGGLVDNIPWYYLSHLVDPILSIMVQDVHDTGDDTEDKVDSASVYIGKVIAAITRPSREYTLFSQRSNVSAVTVYNHGYTISNGLLPDSIDAMYEIGYQVGRSYACAQRFEFDETM